MFDFRFFDARARRLADAVIVAASDLRPVRVGAAASDFTLVKRRSYGPTVADDGTPAGYPETDVDPSLSVVAFDDISDPAHPTPLATWFVWGEHPEMLDGNDLLASEWVNTTYRIVDREVGGVTLLSQRDLGTSETGKDAAAHAPQLRQEFSHREYRQVEYAARLVSEAIETTRTAITAGVDGVEVPQTRAGTPVATPTTVVDWRTDLPVGTVSVDVMPPGARMSPTVSNCRTEKAFRGNPGAPVVGLPDCEFAFGSNGGNPVLSQAGIDPRVTYDTLRDAGVPVPDNYGFPSVVSLEETTAVHLQAFRLGEIGITLCPCEQFADQSRNIETRLDRTHGNLWYGWDWTANYTHPGWEPGVIYDGQDADGDGQIDEGHGPVVLPDANGETWCIPLDGDGNDLQVDEAADAVQWRCRNPNFKPSAYLPPRDGQPEWLDPVPDVAFRRMKAQIYNDAAGWDATENSLAAESEPTDPAQVWGNVTHEELDQVMEGGGYALVLPVAMSNDYFGYIPSYREFQSHDHYRKALEGLGPHSADFLATRLSRLAASLKGGPAFKPSAKDQAAAAEEARMEAWVQAVGTVATTGTAAYEATLPADGGTPAITEQPTDITRFATAQVSWIGGSTYTDTPNVSVERCVDPTSTCAPDDPDAWQPYATGEGEVEVKVDFPQAEQLPAYRAGQYAWPWTATFEAFDGQFPLPDATGTDRMQTPAGTYRFVITGCHRAAVGTGEADDPSAAPCHAADPTGRVSPYVLRSTPFAVTPWDGLTVDDLRIDGRAGGPAQVSFTVGPAPDFPVATSNTEALFDAGTAQPIDYPDSYASPFDVIEDTPEVRGYDPTTTVDDERFCFACTFRPWADTGVAREATVVVTRRGSGRQETASATYDPTTGRFVADVRLAPGDTVQVPAGGVVDAFGEVNGAASGRVVAPL